MPRGIYQRTGPTGFLHPQNEHVVSVSGMGVAYRGHIKREAYRTFGRWSKLSQEPLRRASGQKITHTINGKLHQTFLP